MTGKKSILAQLSKAGNQQEQKVTGSADETKVLDITNIPEQKGEGDGNHQSLAGEVLPPPPQRQDTPVVGEAVLNESSGVLPMESVLLPYPEFGLKPKTNVTVINEVLFELKKLSLAHSTGSGKKVDVNHMVNTILAHWLSLSKKDRERYIKKYL